MKKINVLIMLLGVLLVNNAQVFAQSKIKDGTVTGTGNLPHAAAIVEFESNNKGLLLPRVALTATNLAAPLSTFVEGMTVYNTATAGTAPNQVTPGYYYSNGTKWVRLADASTAAADSTNDGWKDDVVNMQVKLAYKADGSTPRTAGTEFVVKDDGKVGIGTTAPTRQLEVIGETKTTRLIARGPADDFSSVAVGDSTLSLVTTTNKGNVAVGYKALHSNTTGAANVAIGYKALAASNANNSNNNVAIGKEALAFSVAGNQNLAIGTSSMGNADPGNQNVAIGYNAGYNLNNPNVKTGNTLIGWQAGLGVTTGINNTFIGHGSGSLMTTGNNNTIIGVYNGSTTPALNNFNNNIIFADGEGNQRIRVLSDGKTGIGTATPQKQLHVNGALQITNELNVGGNDATAGNAGTAGQVLTSNGAGAAPSWTTVSGGGASTTTAQTVTVAAGATSASLFTWTGTYPIAYRVKIFSRNSCGATFYNEFIVTGSNTSSNWTMNYIGGASRLGTPAATRTSYQIEMANPTTNDCASDGGETAFKYTLSVGANTGALKITNNGGASRDYRVIIEREIDSY